MGKDNKMYFTTETEDAIVAYNNSDNEIERNRIFSSKIYYPFYKIAENVLNTFKFMYFENDMEDVKLDVVSHLVEKMHLYEKEKGKAFGYFSVTAKNYLIQLNNSNYKYFKKTNVLSEMPESWDAENDFIDTERGDEYDEFVDIFIEFWDKNLNIVFTKRRDIQIADSIIELFRRSDNIENFNKKHLYLLIREMTDHRTSYITKILQTIKQYQRKLYNDYYDTGDFSLNVFDYGFEFPVDNNLFYYFDDEEE